MTRFRTIAAGISVVILLATGAARAEQHVYQYDVQHPTYGNIGTYINTVTQDGDKTDVQTQLHIAVKVLGISMFHQDASRVEHWQKDRLVGFEGATDDNGTKLDVTGHAQADNFVISGPLGTITAPARVHPSNPWTPTILQTDTMMGTKTGKITAVKVTNTGMQNIAFGGQMKKVHQFFVDDDKHMVVWVSDDNNTVVGFQTVEGGSAITFVLKQLNQAASAKQAVTASQQIERAGQ